MGGGGAGGGMDDMMSKMMSNMGSMQMGSSSSKMSSSSVSSFSSSSSSSSSVMSSGMSSMLGGGSGGMSLPPMRGMVMPGFPSMPGMTIEAAGHGEQFKQKHVIPDNIDLDAMSSSFSSDGVLVIKAPKMK